MPTGARLGLAVGVALRPTTATGASRPSVSATASDGRPVRLAIRARLTAYCNDPNGTVAKLPRRLFLEASRSGHSAAGVKM